MLKWIDSTEEAQAGLEEETQADLIEGILAELAGDLAGQ